MRGALGNVTTLMLVTGILFVMVLGSLVQWHILTGICILCPGNSRSENFDYRILLILFF